MNNDIKTLIVTALEDYRGDDLERMTFQFRGCSEKQMDQLYGQSSSTPREILERERVKARSIEVAIKEIKALP